MKKIGFIGAYDKTDFITYIAKSLVEMNKKVIFIDTTTNQKAKYIVPAISPTTSYITDYEGIDVAVGLYSFEEIAQYLGVQNFAACDYEYVFIDADAPETIEKFDLYTAEKNYFVTSFDMYSLKRGVEILSGIKTPMELTKILFSKYMTKSEDDYLNYLAMGSRIKWNDEKIYFPFDTGDQSVIIENQRVSKLKVKNLSSPYKESLMYLASEITGENINNIKKVFKQRMN